MTSSPSNLAGTAPRPLWSAPLRLGTGMLAAGPDDVCVVSLPGLLSAYTNAGKLLWETPVTERPVVENPVVTPDGSFLRFEGGAIVERSLRSGQIVSSFAAPHGSALALAPWGDLVYTQPGASGTATVQCVTRTGAPRWSVSLGRRAPLFIKPVGVGDLVIIERHGAVSALDRDGQCAWTADHTGLRLFEEGDSEPAANGGDALDDTPQPVDSDRAVVNLRWFDGSGLYLLDARKPCLTALAVPCPANPPFRVLPPANAETANRVVGLGAQIDLGQMTHRYPVVCFEPGGAVRWSHPLEAKAIALRETPQGALIATANPTGKRWREYSQYYDLSLETFVCCIGADGARRWIWNSSTPLTHLPVVSASGVVYVATNQELRAFATV